MSDLKELFLRVGILLGTATYLIWMGVFALYVVSRLLGQCE